VIVKMFSVILKNEWKVATQSGGIDILELPGLFL